MSLAEIVGYLLVAVAFALAVGGIWAASYYSPGKIYGRMRMRERRKQRSRSATHR